MFPIETKILIVDDMATMRKIVLKILKDMGFKNITEAADGDKAWRTLKESPEPFQLVISDWNMPNCTGIDFLRKVRADEKYKALPFLLLTAEAERDQVAEAVKAGVSNYVLKPFTPESLKGKLQAVYSRLNGPSKAA